MKISFLPWRRIVAAALVLAATGAAASASLALRASVANSAGTLGVMSAGIAAVRAETVMSDATSLRGDARDAVIRQSGFGSEKELTAKLLERHSSMMDALSRASTTRSFARFATAWLVVSMVALMFVSIVAAAILMRTPSDCSSGRDEAGKGTSRTVDAQQPVHPADIMGAGKVSLRIIHYELTRAAAYAVAPVLRLTGFRFSKAWRGNRVISHVEANLLADGIKPERIRF